MGKKAVRKIVSLEEINSFEGYQHKLHENVHILLQRQVSKKGRDRGFQEILRVEELGESYIISFCLCQKEVDMVPCILCKKMQLYYWQGNLYVEVILPDDTTFYYDCRYNQVKEEEISY